MAGVSSLFTREFFALARSRLREGGLFCQWMHVYGMATQDVRTVVGGFADVFPESGLFQVTEGETVGSSICGEGDGGPRERLAVPPQPFHHQSEGSGVVPGPAERSDSCLPRLLVDLGCRHYAPRGAPVKRQSARAICSGGSALSP